MMLDQHEARAWADHGPQFSAFVSLLGRRYIRPMQTGVNVMIEHNLEHLRRFALAVAAFIVGAAFIGVAVLPAALGLTAA